MQGMKVMKFFYFSVGILYVSLIDQAFCFFDPLAFGIDIDSIKEYADTAKKQSYCKVFECSNEQDLTGDFTGIDWIKDFADTVKKQSYCKVFECCNEQYLTGDFTGLKNTLDAKLYGQNIVKNTIVAALRDHFLDKEPMKALTLSFHGWTGCGKNYVTNFIKKAMYKEGENSKFIHHFTARIHFPLEERVEEYKANLQNWIKGNISNCERSLFVFDDVHLMPKNVLNAIVPMLDYNDKVDNIDCRKAIFIFISNTGKTIIRDHLLSLWEQGVKREDIELHDFESLILKGAFNEEGGFQYSDTIKGHVIDYYIPFLPMEKEHVILCITNFFRMKKVEPTEAHIEEVINQVEWEPLNRFSSTGCKAISPKVVSIIAKYKLKHN